MQRNILLMGGLMLLAGCGQGAKASANGHSESGGSGPVAEQAATASKPNCFFVRGQTAPAGQPADDILGVRQGMTLKQVRDVLLCKNANYAINTSTSTLSLPSGGEMSEVDMTANTGQDKVEAWLVGSSGKEKLVRVERTVQFDDNKQLPVQGIVQDISKKYGQFDVSGNPTSGVIVRALDGEQITSENSNYSQCENSNIQTNSQLPCLSVVSYQVQTSAQNPQLASSFDVSVMNDAAVWSMVQAAEQELAAQVNQARSSPAPKL